MLWVAALTICFVKIVVSFLSILGYVLAPLTFRHVILGSKKRNWSCKDSKDNRLDRSRTGTVFCIENRRWLFVFSSSSVPL